jgi:cell pole-organizing protein PopZ
MLAAQTADEPPAAHQTEAFVEPLEAEEPKAESDEVLVLDRSMMVNDGVALAESTYKSSLLEAATSRDPTPITAPLSQNDLMPHPFPLHEEEQPAEPVAAEPTHPASAAPEVTPVSVAPAHFVPPALDVPQPTPTPKADQPGLMAADTAAIAQSAIGNLVRTLAAERVVPVQRGGLTIEDLVRQELRPLLKSWLDQHLPPLVEKQVQVEIERVVNRATS